MSRQKQTIVSLIPQKERPNYTLTLERTWENGKKGKLSGSICTNSHFDIVLKDKSKRTAEERQLVKRLDDLQAMLDAYLKKVNEGGK